MKSAFMTWADEREKDGSALDEIAAGDSVTIRTPQGAIRRGRAVMRGPLGWVLNLGGAYGTPGIATATNIVSFKKRRAS